MNKHMFWMIIGCGIPFLLLLFAPSLGLSNTVTYLLFFVAMIACHVLMFSHHRKGAEHPDHRSNTYK